MNKQSIIIGLIILITAIVVAGIYKSNSTTPNNPNENMTLKTVSGDEFAAKWSELKGSGARLIDVRTPEEYSAGHYEGAEMIDFYSPDFASKLSALDKDAQYFIYCRSGSRSGQTLELMRSLGFSKVYNLAGGFAGNGAILPIAN